MSLTQDGDDKLSDYLQQTQRAQNLQIRCEKKTHKNKHVEIDVYETGK